MTRQFSLIMATATLVFANMGTMGGTASTLSSLPPMAAALAPTDYAPVDRPGPPLRVPTAVLDNSLACSPNLATAGRKPVLFLHATWVDPVVNFSWNYQRAFDADHRPYCLLTLPNRATTDIQVSAEYVVSAIRTMHRRSGHQVDIIGHSQGGMIGRWATRFWPDTRPMVDDIVALGPSNHGSNPALCQIACQPAVWQQTIGSRFLAALNAGQETFAGISYTVIYTRIVDEFITPNLDANLLSVSALHTGPGQIRNVAVQDVCLTDVNEHFTLGTSDPVAYALAIDAIDRPGPADPARINASVCTQLVQPGVDPVALPTNLATVAATFALVYTTYPRTLGEPPLMSYVYR
jgi:pimeloyl-ACP methyl ester carboxylesterase